MALLNPNNLYSGGQVLLDSTPYVNAYKREKAQQEAKDIALDKYYQNLPNTVNDKGVRDQEIPLINEGKNALQQYWMQNRDAIRKGNTPQNFNYQKMLREMGGIIQESKNRNDVTQKIAKLRGNPKYDYIFRNPQIIGQIEGHDMPIGSQGAKGIDFNQLTLPPEPFDQKKYIQTYSDIKPETSITYEKNPNDRFSNIEVSTPSLNKEGLDTIYQRATTALFNDPSFHTEIQRAVQDPATAAHLSKVFKDTFKRDVQNEADLAAAYTVVNMPMAPKRKNIPNWEAREAQKFANKKYLANLQDRLIRARGGGGNPQDIEIYDIFSKIEKDIKDPNKAINKGDERIGTRLNALDASAQNVILDFGRKLTGNNDLGNDDVFLHETDDGRLQLYRTTPYKKNVNNVIIGGGPTISKEKLIGEIPRIGTNLKAQPSVKEKRVVIKQGDNPKKVIVEDIDYDEL